MKKIVLVVMCLGLFFSCGNKDLYEEPVPTPENNENAQENAQENAEKVFGTTFDPNQDWCSTLNGEVTIEVNETVTKVQILVEVCEVNEDCPSYVSRNSMYVLNEANVNGESSVKLTYDAPKDNLGLWAVFYTKDNDYLVAKIHGQTVSIKDVITCARTRTIYSDYVLPIGDFKISTIKDSYAAERNWVPGEKLYDLSDADYAQLKMNSDPYSPGFLEVMEKFIDDNFPNGRTYDNREKVFATGCVNENSYPITTGDEPIIVTPVYKCDNPVLYGNEVYNSELYYYYFKDSDLANLDENGKVAYLKALPKYKAIPLNQCFMMDGDDDIFKKYGSFALLYYGDGTPSIGTKGTFKFEPGYKIGFMVRANTDWDEGKKKGEVYCDGRLNDKINKDRNYNFSSSKLEATDPRAAWLTINKHLLLCWESGTDKDFNDIIMEVEGGIDGPNPPPVFDKMTYTFCFEDTWEGDYDMNDVVIKAVRENETTVSWSVIACGAYDELYIHNITEDLSQKEVHSLFGKQPKQFVNTVASDEKCAPYTFTVTVTKDYSLTTARPYIYDATKEHAVYMSEAGQNPFGIMIPNNFKYPLEKISINKAYPLFNNWGENAILSTFWYWSPDLSKVYTK